MLHTTDFVILSAVLFILGAMGVLLRRNAILLFMSVELMLNAINARLDAFNINSTDINSRIALRRSNTPIAPRINNTALKITKSVV